MNDIPDPDHLARYCKPVTIPDGELQASAFMLRAGESYLSANWLEFFNSTDRKKQIHLLQNVFAKKFKNVPAKAEFAVLESGGLRAHVARNCPEYPLTVLHVPEADDPSHAGIYGTSNAVVVAELLLEVVLERYPAKA